MSMTSELYFMSMVNRSRDISIHFPTIFGRRKASATKFFKNSRVHNMSVSHHTEQKIHFFNIDEAKNVGVHFTSVSDFGL